MTLFPHNLANVPADLLDEELLTRAIARGDKAIHRAFETIREVSQKQIQRRVELQRQQARRARSSRRE